MHGALSNFLGSMREQVPLMAADRLLAVTTIGFDIAALELYLPLLAGASVAVAARHTVRDPMALASLIEMSGATVDASDADAVADRSSARRRSCRCFGRLRVLTGGEALSGELAGTLRAHGRSLTNLYGPTETTIWSAATVLEADDLDGKAPPIGRPIRTRGLCVGRGS